MAFNDQQQQQQQEEQPNQLQPYGVSFGARRIRSVQRVPYVLDMNIGRPSRARQLHAHPVREQHHVMLQDRVNQDMLQHTLQQQDNIACNPRPYQDQTGYEPKSARGGCTYGEPTQRTSK